MLQPEELRIGNLVRLMLNHSDYNDIEIEMPDLNLIHNRNGRNEYCPIPLSEKWLLKFGFSPTTDGYWSNEKLEVGYTTNDEFIQYEFISVTHKTEMTDLKFVHQLQNLFYALTGEELTLNK